METIIISFNYTDEIRLKRIVLDKDRDDALKFAKELLGKITALSSKGMKSHLDK